MLKMLFYVLRQIIKQSEKEFEDDQKSGRR